MARPTQLSPGVNFTEIDFSLIAREPSSTITGIAGEYPWGPGGNPVTVDTARRFEEVFGVPGANDNVNSQNDYRHALNFLRYGDNLSVVRALQQQDYNAHSGFTAATIHIPNQKAFDALVGQNDPRTVDNTHAFVAKYPGSYGNSLKIVVIDDLVSVSEQLTVSNYEAIGISGGSAAYGVTFGTVRFSIKTDDGDATTIPYRFYFVNGPSGATYQNTIVPANSQNKTAIEQAILTNGLIYTLSNAGNNPVISDPLSLITTVPNIQKLPNSAPPFPPKMWFHINTAGDTVGSRMTGPNSFISFVSGANPSGITIEGFFLFVQTSSPEHSYITNNTFKKLKFTIPAVVQNSGSSESGSVVEGRAFTKTPGTSAYAASQGGSNDEISVAVIDEGGKFTGVKGYVLETFELLSKATDAKDAAGNDNYWKNVINQRSQYVWAFADLPGNGTMSGPASTSFGSIQYTPYGSDFVTLNQLIYSLTGGVQNYLSDDLSLYDFGYVHFANTNVPVDLIIDHRANTVLTNSLIDMAESRKDILVCSAVQPSSESQMVPAATSTMIAKRNEIRSSSYCAIAGGLKYSKDPRFGYVVTMNHASDLAGLIVSSTESGEPWFSPAGFNRGQIRNVSSLVYNPTKVYRDELYKNEINPIASFPGSGIVLFGDKTALKKPSALDRINVRRLFVVLEKALSEIAKYVIGEFNDEYTRSAFTNLVNQFMRSIQSRKGVVDFRVVCDETNNTAQVIDSNQFVADIYIKPTRSINFIQLNFVATRSDVNMSIIE